jgi:PAS domain S-box-containing protein
MATLTNQWYTNKAEWSNTLPFASPESDFTASDRFTQALSASREGPNWSGLFSFASPESDFVGMKTREDKEENRASWSESLSYASPEADFSFQDKGESSKSAEFFEPFILSLSLLASPETAIGVVHYGEMLDDTTKRQLLEHMRQQESLPKTLSEALADPRPIVVTSPASPFDIVDVNEAWVGLCGYSREESVNQNLGDLLQGPETSVRVARDMISRLKREHHSEALITNYTKSGRKFQNHVKVGLLSTDDGADLFFVGVLEEIGTRGVPDVHLR